MPSGSQRKKRRAERGIVDDNDPRKYYQGDGYIRLAVYPVDQIIPMIRRGEEFDDKGFKLNLSSQRLLTFNRSIVCVSCGIVGELFALERHKGSKKDTTPHLNLYAIDKNRYEVLMTKDHIIPKSRGGKNSMSNFQTMCHFCNVKKGSIIQP